MTISFYSWYLYLNRFKVMSWKHFRYRLKVKVTCNAANLAFYASTAWHPGGDEMVSNLGTLNTFLSALSALHYLPFDK